VNHVFRKSKNGSNHRLEGVVTSSRSLFIDSGAHSLYNREVDTYENELVTSYSQRYDYFDLKDKNSDFRKYVRRYVKFIKEETSDKIDYYVTLDAIYHPDKSLEIYDFLVNEYGLSPVPVVHCETPFNFVDEYIERGCTFLGIGGLGQGVSKSRFFEWGDQLFNYISAGKDRTPVIRTHGFAMTSWELLLRYPWWSVDSASWLKAAAFGQVYVPNFRDGKFVFEERNRPYTITASARSPNAKEKWHISNLEGEVRKIVRDWFDFIRIDIEGNHGILNSLEARSRANLLFFTRMARELVFPRSCSTFNIKGVFNGPCADGQKIKAPKSYDNPFVEPHKLQIYFSGLSGGGIYPEHMIAEKSPAIMLSFDNLRDQMKRPYDKRASTAWIRFKAHRNQK